MFRGKETCKILKQIRQTIASENDIPLVVEECHYKGECRGTCPRCEAELEYLEKELLKRRSMGKKIMLAGLSAGLSCTPMVAAENVQSNAATEQDSFSQKPIGVVVKLYNEECPIQVKGKVKDSKGNPLRYASVYVLRSNCRSDYSLSDSLGNYSISVKYNDTLRFGAYGFRSDTVKIVADSSNAYKEINLDIVLKEGKSDNRMLCGGICTVSEEYLGPPPGPTKPLIRMDEYRSKDGKRNIHQDMMFNKVYPLVREMNQEVRVKVKFIINEDCSLSDIKVVKSDDERFNETAMETIRRMDGWRCRKVNGKNAKSKQTVTVLYRKEELVKLMNWMDK
ncbi:MAG: TonB family protein [Paludibacteraceae bacterium]|nr:TonB family protein [Paludibacteraceae bacterium]